MKGSSFPTVLRSLGLADSSTESDAALLGRFVADGDQAAFAALVRRYAGLVWRVARTRCRTDATAEDVFQAAFVVLARNAESIRAPVALAGWLHLVAHRLAVKAARKDRPSTPLPAAVLVPADPLDALCAREILAAVDDEMAKLSGAERAVLVLCGVDSCTLDEAARRLGWTVGSVKGRLERARARLRARLGARGLTVPAILVGLIGSPSAATVQAAIAAAGQVPPPAVAHLIAEGLTMKGTITKAALVLALVGALLAAGGWGERPVPRVTAAPVPKGAPRETRLLVWVGDKPVLLRPDGTVLDGPAAVPDATRRVATSTAVSSPDGTRVVFAGETDPPEPIDDSKGVVLRRGVRLLTLKPGETPQVVKRVGASYPVWLGNNRLVLSGRELAADGTAAASRKTWVYDTATGTRTLLKVPEQFVVQAVSPDGRSAVAIDVSNWDDPFTRPCHLVSLDGGKTVPLLGADHVVWSSSLPRFSPDGGRVLLWAERVAIDPNKKVGDTGRVKILTEQLLAVDVKTRKVVAVADAKDAGRVSGWQWSPAGKRVAFVRQKWDAVRGKDLKGKSQLFVTVADADGRNPKDVFETRGSFEHTGRTGVTATWSPDGRRLAVLHQAEDANKKCSARVVVMDPDGCHLSEIYKTGDTSWVLMGFDWR